ncbi:unnamed protein product [Pleuronectes platessa]|uniref:Cytochrome c oxidase assembly factor 5 n=1 Tax=Pleuronectes platessa TaxID=8262 RepID=A0A9N7VVT3_PLEPL|nr:unnamed protein product [Pleuronectes platessa]
MPKYYEDKETDDRACAGVREDFRECLLRHDCVVKELYDGKDPVITNTTTHHIHLTVSQPKERGKLPSECLKEGHCKALQTSFFECKRSMLDTRSRFRGRKGY